uniref:Arp2/3 complex 34 kDa subunit n=1 Tax=Rhizophagus irregularis (strain DAOM 181602 / DAOM 197198 / MUCL 43194) TaxID=747089 RepID=U9U9N4_RHIID
MAHIVSLKKICQREELVKKLTLIKFERAFEQQARFEDEKQPNLKPDLMQIHYRNQEAIYIQAQFDRVIVFLRNLLMHVVIQLFKMLHKYYTQARREIRYLQNTSKNEDIGYVTFVLFPRHFAEGVSRMSNGGTRTESLRIQQIIVILGIC